MLDKIKLWPALLIFILLVNCTTSPKPAEESPRDVSGEMASFLGHLTSLIPVVAKRESFHAPAHREQILADVRGMKQMGHLLDAKFKSRSPDPAGEFFSKGLNKEVEEIDSALHGGQVEYARQRLLGLTSHCARCHLSSGEGPEYQYLEKISGFNQLSPLKRADFLIATRQFEKALQEYVRVLETPRKGPYQQFEWDQALRHALSIVVRDNPSVIDAENIVGKALQSPGTPKYLQGYARSWAKSIDSWKREKEVPPQTFPAVLTYARRTLAKARAQQTYPGDRSADILLLRVQSALRKALQNARISRPEHAEAIFILGTVSESLQNVDYWNMHELYYERCIHLTPKTRTAQNCFDRLEQSIVLGYTGSGGQSLPPAEVVRLKALRAQAY